jgi:hypothetical protein
VTNMIRGRRLLLFCLLVAVASTKPPELLAINLTPVVSVTVYASNNDYLAFTVHLTELPTFFVVRELICTIDLTTKDSRHVLETFQLTELPPHFFASAPADVVLYVPHNQSSPRILSESCVGTSIFSKGTDNSNNPVLQASADNSKTSEDRQGAASRHPASPVITKTGSVTSSAKLIHDAKSPSSDEREFLDAVSRLGGATLYEPQAQDVITALSKPHSSASVKHEDLDHTPKPTPIGQIPQAKTSQGISSNVVAGRSQQTGTAPNARPSESTKPLAVTGHHGDQGDSVEASKPANASQADIPSGKDLAGAASKPEPTNSGAPNPPSVDLPQLHPYEGPSPDPKSSQPATTNFNAISTGVQESVSSHDATQNKQVREEADSEARDAKRKADAEARDAKKEADSEDKPEKEKTSKPKKETSSTEHKRE